MKAIYLRWVDSNSSRGWQQHPNECVGLSEIETIGYLIYEDDERVDIAQSHIIDCEIYSEVLSIAKVAIVERHTLKLPKQPQNDVI